MECFLDHFILVVSAGNDVSGAERWDNSGFNEETSTFPLSFHYSWLRVQDRIHRGLN